MTLRRNRAFFLISLREIFALAAVFGFFVNLSTLSIVGEIVLQLVLAILVGTRVVASSERKYQQARQVIDVLLTVIGLAMIAFTVADLMQRKETLDTENLLLMLLMTFWLPLVSLIFLYGFALFAAYEVAFKMMAFPGTEQDPPDFKAKLALLFGLNFHVRDVFAFRGGWGGRVKRASTLRLALEEVGAFRQ